MGTYVDQVLTSLVDFIEGVEFPALPGSAVDRVARHTVDAVACGAGGFSSGPARVAREVAGHSGGPLVASMYGEPEPVRAEFAAFANATANRYLDFNDFGSSGHPSDMIPAMLAVAEAVGASGPDVITGIYLAYEIAIRIAEAVPPDGGWDQGAYCSLGIAAGLSKIMRLSREQAANALSLAIVPSLSLRVTRFGELSEWKAAATAHAAMTAIFSTQLAAHGMTGPPSPFEGKDGLLERVWPSFSLNLGTVDGPSAIERASLKRFPACYWGQVPVDLMTQLRAGAAVAQITSIEVETCQTAWWTIGGGRGDAAEKWRPPTRETADHSMPYLLAAILIDGQLDDSAFTAARLSDPELLAVMDRITVTERTDLTSRATRDRCPTELTIRLADGSALEASSDVPRGHHANPMTDEEVNEKADRLLARALPASPAKELREHLWGLAHLDDLRDTGRLLRGFSQVHR